MARALISNQDHTFALVRAYLDRGYYVIPAGGAVGRKWLASKSGRIYNSPSTAGEPPDKTDVLKSFYDNLGSGISIALPHLRDGNKDLIALDFDLADDADTIRILALVISYPCPIKFGSKGATFFVRYPTMEFLPDILRQRDIKPPKWVANTEICFIRPDTHDLPIKAMDFLGMSLTHSMLPPSLSTKATDAAGEPRYYEWLPWPLAPDSTPIDLMDTDPGDLPEITPADMLLIYQWAKNPNTALWKYIGATGSGDHHGRMLAATTYMWHEKFNQEEITTICYQEAARTAENEDTLEQRKKEIDIAVRKLPHRFEEQKPSREPVRAKPKTDKTPLNRQMYNWLCDQYQVQNLAYFTSMPYHWDGKHWHRMINMDLKDPWAPIYNALIQQFMEAGHGDVSLALKAFQNAIPFRQAQPDPFIIPFNNCVLDVRTNMTREEMQDDNIPQRLDFDYDPSVECPLWDQFLKTFCKLPAKFAHLEQIDYQRTISTIEEFFGYCLVRSHQFQKMLFIIGPTGRGKSVLMKVIRGILPPHWTSTVDMHMFDDSNSLMQMVQSNVNISAEIGRRNKNVDAALLKITAAEDVQVKLLYENKVNVVLPARLVFHGNLPPDTTDVTGAIERRMIILYSTDLKPPDVPDYHLRLLAEKAGIVLRLASAYGRLLERGYFDLPSYVEGESKKITRESNSVTAWMDDRCEDVEHIREGTHSPDLFADYMEWCTINNMYKQSVISWGKTLTALDYPALQVALPGNRVVRFRKIKLKGQHPVTGYDKVTY